MNIKIAIDIAEGLKSDFEEERWTALVCAEMKSALEKGTILSKGNENLIDVEQMKWTPVNERLPDPQDDGDKDFSDWLLVTINLGKDNDAYVGEAYYCFSEQKWYAKRFVTGEVTAWCKLPQPYKADTGKQNKSK